MSKKTKDSGANLQTLKIGSRVRCADDGVEGRIAWANGVSVKIKWDDGEQVTWRRDSLAGRPIQILDADGGEEATEASLAPSVAEQAATTEPPTESVVTAATPETPAETEVLETRGAIPAAEQAPPSLQDQLAGSAAAADNERSWDLENLPDHGHRDGSAKPPAEETPATRPSTDESETPPAKTKRQRKAPAEPKEKKVSAIDAAVRVLAEEGRAMTCKELIGVMALKGYWSSPGGKTPDATLCSAMLREISVKGEQTRFVKAAPGRFALRPTTE